MILGLLLDTKKLIEDLQYNLEVIKQFKCNTKNFYNSTSRSQITLNRNYSIKMKMNLPRYQNVLISYLNGLLYE